jgi:hypothetical protein
MLLLVLVLLNCMARLTCTATQLLASCKVLQRLQARLMTLCCLLLPIVGELLQQSR